MLPFITCNMMEVNNKIAAFTSKRAFYLFLSWLAASMKQDSPWQAWRCTWYMWLLTRWRHCHLEKVLAWWVTYSCFNNLMLHFYMISWVGKQSRLISIACYIIFLFVGACSFKLVCLDVQELEIIIYFQRLLISSLCYSIIFCIS